VVLVDERYGQGVIDHVVTRRDVGGVIWEDVVREHEASDHGDTAADDARSKIAERYLGFVAHWTR
jgi:hypothetical protein